MRAWYATREDVKSALDFRETARTNRQIDGAIGAGAESVDGCLHRRFYPLVATRYFPWPERFGTRDKIWFDEHDLISATAITSGGQAVTSYLLEPVNEGPPYQWLELDRSTNAAFSPGNTSQRNVAITGLWDYSNDELAAGLAAEALDSSETGLDVNGAAASLIGVGSILRIDSERMVVTGRSWLDTTQNLGTPLTASLANVTVAVTTGSAFAVGEILLLDSERMEIIDIAGNNLTVKRAVDGSVLASHTGSDIYASRTLTVSRGALGTTAASHSDAAAINLKVMPDLIREFNVALALTTLLGRQSGYARVVGTGEGQREASGRGLKEIRAEAIEAHGRRGRSWAV